MVTRSTRARRDPWFSSTERVVESQFITPNRVALLVIILVAAAVSLFYLWTTWQAVDWINERRVAEQELIRLENERERLRFEVEQAFSLKRIEARARGTLGMILPTINDETLKYLDLNTHDAED